MKVNMNDQAAIDLSLAHVVGQLALSIGKRLPLSVCESRAGFYLGIYSEDGPCSRESVQYWPTKEAAATALRTGAWTQRLSA